MPQPLSRQHAQSRLWPVLDEDGALPDISDLSQYRLPDERPDQYDQIVHALQSRAAAYGELAAALPFTWDARPDNHTHQLRVGPIEVMANASAPETILFDIAVLERLGRPDVELVGNSFGQSLIDAAAPAIAEADLAHILVIDNVPNYLQPRGPYHPIIDEARRDRFLQDFRRWITETSGETRVADAVAMKQRVEERLRDAQEELFLRHLDPRAGYYTFGKTLTSAVADLVVPYVGTAATAISDLREARAVKRNRWQGFLISFRRAARDGDADDDDGARVPRE
jgi:hypothetical protein